MPKIYATLPEKLIEDLNNISEQTAQSFSKVVHQIIDLGLSAYKSSPNLISPTSQSTLSELDLKNLEYFLRILNINSEILRKLYNAPSEFTGKTANSILADIKAQVKNHMATNFKTPNNL